jgi:hypothetical protein
MERTALAKLERTESSVKNESVFQEIANDCWSIGAGIGKGLKAGVNDAMAHPVEFAARVGIIMTTGFVLGGIQRGAGLLRLTGEAALVGGTISAFRNLRNTGFDSSLRTDLTRDTRLGRTGEKIGQFLFDTAVFTAAGAASAKFSQKMFSNVDFSSSHMNSPSMSSFDRMIMEKMNTRGWS